MKLDLICKKHDEYYTPRCAIEPIIKYIHKDKIVWCPFDTEDSNYVKMFKEKGNKVIATHIVDGFDFFKTKVECDVIISNPPYSIKEKIFYKLFEIGIPFAMLVGVVGLFESKNRFSLFANNTFEIMYLNRRVRYFKDYAKQEFTNPPFSSVYLCSGVLPHQIVFEKIEKG